MTRGHEPKQSGYGSGPERAPLRQTLKHDQIPAGGLKLRLRRAAILPLHIADDRLSVHMHVLDANVLMPALARSSQDFCLHYERLHQAGRSRRERRNFGFCSQVCIEPTEYGHRSRMGACHLNSERSLHFIFRRYDKLAPAFAHTQDWPSPATGLLRPFAVSLAAIGRAHRDIARAPLRSCH